MLRSLIARFERLGLQRRIMLYVTAGLAVFSAVYAFVALQAIQQSSDLVFRERLLVARTEARAIDDDIAHIQGELDDASATVASALAAGNVTLAQNSLRTLYSHWTLFHRFDKPCLISLTDPGGRVLWSEPDLYNLVGRDLAQLPYLQNAFQFQRATITNGIAPAASARPTVALAVPVRAGTQTQGFLVGEIDRAHFGRRLEPALDVGEVGYAVELIDDAGLVIASNTKGKQLSTSPHLQLIASLLRAGQSGVRTHTFSFNDEERSHVIAFAPLTRIAWGVVAEQQVDEALILPRNLQTQFIAFGLLALAGGLVLAWITTRAVVRPVNALIDASQKIARGDLQHPLDVSSADEMGILARSFDEMRVRLRESHAEIARWNRELEARVEQRTRELAAAVERVEQRSRELAALVESSKALTSTLELDAVFEILMRETRAVLPSAEGSALFLFEPETQTLAIRSSFGLDLAESAQLRFRVGEAIAGKVFETQTPALLKTATEVRAAQANFSTENRAHFLHAIGDREVQGALGVPLVSKGTRLGALMLYNFTREGAFTEPAAPLLEALANQAATAIENARLYHEASQVGALRELNRVKSEFVARASHELRTPLTGIKRLAEILLRDDLKINAPTHREFLKEIDRTTDRLASIVEELLTLARIEAGRFEVKPAPIAVEELITRVVGQFRIQYPARAIQTVFAQNLAPAWGDAERLADVLTNLLSNALKYSDADSPVVVQAEQPGSRMIVSVRDRGIGIPREAQGKIFERFYRVDNPLTRRVGGAGLGLHICKRYVEAMGGTIWFESEDGRGSVFSFSLSCADEVRL